MGHIEVIRSFYEDYYSSIDFKKWQNEFSSKINSSLYSSKNLREDKIVECLCKEMSNQKYKGLLIESKKIHSRSTSGVEFNHIDKKTVKELADMVIVSVVTDNDEIMLLKIAFIQNKKATMSKTSPYSWKIEQKQLFLLKNFPTFIGVSGYFKSKEITFQNHSSTLGNYGLFTPTGDMVFLTARNVFCNQNSRDIITFNDIKKASSLSVPLWDTVDRFYPYYKYKLGHCCINPEDEECLALLTEWYNSPFFNNYNYALDVNEIVKQLTYFNIGENVVQTTDNTLYSYTKYLLNQFEYTIGDDNKLKRNQKNNDIPYESETHVILNHLELAERKD